MSVELDDIYTDELSYCCDDKVTLTGFCRALLGTRMKVLYASKIEKIETRADRTLKIVIGTAREMSASDKAALFALADQEGWTLHSFEDDLTEADLPDEKPDKMTGRKTKAQTMRGIIYRIWELNGRKGNSEDHYQRYMDGLNQQLKSKLE